MSALSQLLEKQAQKTGAPPPAPILNAILCGVETEDDDEAVAAAAVPDGADDMDRTVAQCRRRLRPSLAAAISNGIMSAMLTQTVSHFLFHTPVQYSL